MARGEYRQEGGSIRLTHDDGHLYRCTLCGRTFDRDGMFVADVGIGGYEAWGHRYSDTYLAVLSRCCEASVIWNDENGAEVTPRDL